MNALGLRTKFRVALTGTPVENNLGELWSLFHFLMPGFLGDAQTFRNRYQLPIEKDRNEVRLIQLRHRVAPFILRGVSLIGIDSVMCPIGIAAATR